MLTGSLTPHLQECLTHLGAWMPFEQAARFLHKFTGVLVSEPTSRRQTEKTGKALLEVEDEEAERIKREAPPAPPGPKKQLFSVDGAIIPLLHGQWGEVKTLVIGDIQDPVEEKGKWMVHSTHLSYVSRMMSSDLFRWSVLGETHRRGVERAEQVAAVTDGADWEQGFIDFHRPDAVRILDFAHAAERISQVGQSIWGEGTAESTSWFEAQAHCLKHEGPTKVLAELRALKELYPEKAILAENLAYLEKREGMLQYPRYQAEGLPIGSGTVESGNNHVVEDRLKGAGMHWATTHVNPMLALRNAVCNDRWDDSWDRAAMRLRAEAANSRPTRPSQNCPEIPSAASPLTVSQPAPSPVTLVEPDTTRPKAPQPRRPAPDHPWRRQPLGRARHRPTTPNPGAKN